MNKFFEWIEKYKFGLIAVFATYAAIYCYLVIDSYTEYYPIEPFFEEPRLELPKEIEIKAENIEVQNAGDVKNAVRDMNDTRKQSDDNWSSNPSSAQSAEERVKELEEQYRTEAGGAQKRAQIQQEIDRLRKEREQQKNKPKTEGQPKQGGENAPKGNTMVRFELDNRTAYNNNNWYVRNPGYTCPQGSSGTVVIRIRVDQSGNVVDAQTESASGANSCMIEKALQYAKMSRFNYAGTAPRSQEGLIYYTFVSY